MADFSTSPFEPVRAFYPASEMWHRLVGEAPDYTSVVWTVANRARLMPFYVHEDIEVSDLSIANGAVVNGNVDLGIYAAQRGQLAPAPLTRIASTGSTAHAGVNVMQTIALTATVTLGAGYYFMAAVFDGVVAQVVRLNNATFDLMKNRAGNVYEQAAAFPLPAALAGPSFNSIDTIPQMMVHAKDISP